MASTVDRERLAGLDGIRAISILLVLAFHCSETIGFPSLGPLDIFVRNGGFGVEMFFVLSGFLITTLLLKEEQRYGSVSIVSFYARRALRILPPALFYLLVMLLLGFAGLTGVTLEEFAKAASFARNYLPGTWETGHFWSLAVEEQFYFVWPFLLILIPGSARVPFSITGVLAAPFWRYANLKWQWVDNPFRFDLHYDAMLLGCLLAFLRADPKALIFLRKPVLQSWLVPVGVVVAFVGLHQPHLPGVLFTFRQTLLIVSVGLFINYGVDVTGSLVGRILNSRPVVWCGTLSYSLYLWQQLFCWRHAVHPEIAPALGIQQFPLNLFMSVGMAVVSFYAVEKPFNTLRKQLPRIEWPRRRPEAPKWVATPNSAMSVQNNND